MGVPFASAVGQAWGQPLQACAGTWWSGVVALSVAQVWWVAEANLAHG